MTKQEARAEASTLRGRDIICFSNDWDGDPLSKTHIMKILARENRILWVNSVGNRSPAASTQDLRRIGRKLSDFSRGLLEPWPNLHVLGPLALPSFGAFAQKVNRSLLRRQILRAMHRLGFSHPIAWSFLPASVPVFGTLGEDLLIYHCVDEFTAFSGAPTAAIASMEAALAKRADLVFVSAEKLLEAKAKLNSHCYLVRHGVDHSHFRQALASETRIPTELASLPHPVIGFFGLIAEWVDLHLIRAVADNVPEGSVVLLGKVQGSLAPLAGAKNVHLFGRKPYEELPAWCKGWDLALLPFVEGELSENSCPLKAREYLAAGLPVVSTPIPEVDKLRLCRIASGKEAYVRAVRETLEASGSREERSAAIAHESWEARVSEIRSIVEEALAQKKRPSGPDLRATA